MTNVKIGLITRRMPEKWEDVSQKQLGKLLALRYMSYDFGVAALRAVAILLKIPIWLMRFISYESLYQLIERCQWALLQSIEITHNPSLRLGKFVGTHDPIGQFSLWEYILTEQAFLAWMEQPSTENLNNFIAHWYRPAMPLKKMTRLKQRGTWNGDVRVPFSEHLVKTYAKKLKNVSIIDKLGAAHFFAFEVGQIKEYFPNLPTSSDNSKKYSWADTIITLSPINEEDKTVKNKLTTILKRIEHEQKNYARAEHKARPA